MTENEADYWQTMLGYNTSWFMPPAAIISADPSEMAIAVEQPAPEKPRKFHDDITTAEWQAACRKVMTPSWMEY